MVVKLWLLFLLSGCFSQATGQGNGYCNVTVGSDITAPQESLPFLPVTFRTKVEVNFVDKKYTDTIAEYFDGDGNRGALSIFSRNSILRLIYDYATGEILNIDNNNVCVVSNITQDNFLFGDNVVDGRNHIFTSNNAMKFGGKFTEVYIGEDVIRGITVKHWRTCQYMAALKATFTIDYYFADNDWLPTDDLKWAPVRAYVKGEIVQGNGTTRGFEHYYEYFDFHPNLPADMSVFQVPNGIVCPGRKKTKPIPTLPDQYYYRQEIVQPAVGLITFADVWYDFGYRLVRFDYRNYESMPPFYNTHPISEIHDYGAGVAYIVDKSTGSCNTWNLRNTTFDVSLNATSLQANGSYVIHMKDPLQLFYIDNTYTYEGQATIRGALCDRFVSRRNDFDFSGLPEKMNSTFTYFFLSDGIKEVTNTGNEPEGSVPFRLEVSIDAVGYLAIYNFIDFNTENPPLSVYDVKACYPETNRLQLKLRFPDSYSEEAAEVLKLETQIQLAETMQISPLRLQDIALEYDNANMFVMVTLLGPPPPSAEFTYIPKKEIIRNDDKTFPSVDDPDMCAKLCVDNPDFTCNSFDLCPNDKTCKLSKAHVDDGKAVLGDSMCDHFSRTVDGPYSQAPNIIDSYKLLSTAVYGQEYTMDVPLIENGQTKTLTAIEVEVMFGYLYPDSVPSITGQYYYRQEISIPMANIMEQADVWYDYDYKLVRFDTRNPTPVPPYYSTSPMTVIHDFNTGVQYNIDKFFGNCTISAIQNNSFDTTSNVTEKLDDGSYVSRMKNPLELFYLDKTYKWAGQRTVRGILCDVFESARTDFKMQGINDPLNSTFQFYFLADSWTDIANTVSSEDDDVPISLNIMVPAVGYFTTYNFFDFDKSHPDLKNFDVGSCYFDDTKIRFQMEFVGSYHPYIDSNRALFELYTRMSIAQMMSITPLRIQDSRIDYDEASVYYTATLLDRAPPSAQYVLSAGIRKEHKDDKLILNVDNPDACAILCSNEKSFACNSFDLCPSQKLCALSRKHVSEGITNQNVSCVHFSRDVDAPATVEMGLEEAWDAVRDLVYKNVVQVLIPYNGKNYEYTASSIKDVLFTDIPPQLQEEKNMKKFTVFKTNTKVNKPTYTIAQLSVDDCATACMVEETFDCEGFNYCFGNGDCYLTNIHPEEAPPGYRSNTSLCDLYSKNYIDDYTESPGITVLQTGAKQISKVTSQNMCAQLCEKETNFTCKSFDYCELMNGCTLGKKHIFDIPPSDIKAVPQCSHFSRRYVDDFKFTKGKVIALKDNYIISDVNAEKCAKLCVDEERFDCKSFDFCPNITECRLSSAHLNGIGQVTVQPSAYCNHYSRQYFPDNTPYNPNPGKYYKPANQNTGGYTGGSMAGMAVGMAAFGALLALGISALLYKKKTGSSELYSASVGFTKHVNED